MMNTSALSEKKPPLKIISNLKQSVITRLIERHSEWAVTLDKVEKKQALWFYALMSAVEKPLHPDIESSLRYHSYIK